MFTLHVICFFLCKIKEISGVNCIFQVMSWFWKSASLFNQEELARLLQFTTGSSQLPPGGFSCLTPKFSFSSSSLKNVLPVAHTW